MTVRDRAAVVATVARWFMLSLTAATPATSAATAAPPDTVTIPRSDRTALEAATRDLCGRRVALLGEAGTHGDGHTDAFKVALMQRLVTRCHFDAVAFESSRYEFLAFGRALRQGTARPGLLADAVGGLWRFDREFQPLVDFLFAKAKTGRVRLAGLDAQLGGLGETFTNERMIPELLQGVPSAEAGRCQAAFVAHAAWNYPAGHEYGTVEHDKLLACAAAMRRALPARAGIDAATRAEDAAMIDNIAWAIAPDLSARTEQRAARERWLDRNFAAFAATLHRRARIIVWGATVHLARTNAAAADQRYGTFGAAIHDRYGDAAYSLGFAAGGGSYRVFRKRFSVDPPPALSLEARTLATSSSSAVFLDRSRLRRLGVVPGGILDHSYAPADWSGVVDGAVVFREEWPTHSTRPGY